MKSGLAIGFPAASHGQTPCNKPINRLKSLRAGDSLTMPISTFLHDGELCLLPVELRYGGPVPPRHFSPVLPANQSEPSDVASGSVVYRSQWIARVK